jgi:uncharacterized protein involved in type VI secretion and phage assembly
MIDEQGNGVFAGVVTNLDDPEKIGRIRVQFPVLDGEQSYWARLVSPMAGPRRGVFLRPEVSDEVLVAFEHGDPRRAYILGSVWSKADPPPPDDGQATKNNWRFWVARSGALFRFDDTAGAEKVEVIDKDGSRKIVIDSAGSKIQVSCSQGDIELSAPNGTVKITAQNVEVQASQGAKVDGGPSLQIKGSQVNIN